jgi:hypothetical protein
MTEEHVSRVTEGRRGQLSDQPQTPDILQRSVGCFKDAAQGSAGQGVGAIVKMGRAWQVNERRDP